MTPRAHVPVKKVLVASDSRDALLQAVAKAATIEHYTGASVTALLVCHEPITDELQLRFGHDVAARILDERLRTERQALDVALAPWREHIAELDFAVMFSRDTAAAICEAALERAADLIVKPLSRSAHLADFLHTPADWQLMRQAPCAVLFTRAAKWQKPIRVLAALDVMDKAHTALNDEIIRQAALIAAILGGELHVATAFPSLAPYVNQYQVAQDFTSLTIEMHDSRRDALTRLLQRLGVEAAAIHVEEGRSRQVIPALAALLQAGLTIVGTAGRSGLSHLLIGNTAEQLASDLATDLLTVRATERSA